MEGSDLFPSGKGPSMVLWAPKSREIPVERGVASWQSGINLKLLSFFYLGKN
jgi:hypothetical protein